MGKSDTEDIFEVLDERAPEGMVDERIRFDIIVLQQMARCQQAFSFISRDAFAFSFAEDALRAFELLLKPYLNSTNYAEKLKELEAGLQSKINEYHPNKRDQHVAELRRWFVEEKYGLVLTYAHKKGFMPRTAIIDN